MKSQVNFKILQDKKSNGKKNDWQGKKKSSGKIAKTYDIIGKSLEVKRDYVCRGVHEKFKKVSKLEDGTVKTGMVSVGLFDNNDKRVINYEKRAKDMKYCGSRLDFAKMDEKEKLKLIKADFCRVPLCPMCQWRKTLRIFFDVSKITSELENREKNLRPIFLTLTVKNCSLEDLKLVLDKMFKGWHDLMRSKTLNPEIKGKQEHIIKGWFRALEVTYNSETNTFHPHFHAILYVDKNYFKSDDYLKTEDWVQLWRKSARLDYDPVCDVRLIRNAGRKKGIAEVAKYTYKDAEILKNNLSDDRQADVIKSLCDALYQRKLYAYGGLMKSIAAELKLKDVDKADLVNVDGEKLRIDVSTVILRYRWNVGLANYVLESGDDL